MKISALGDVTKIVVFLLASFLLAALISPPFYDMGKGFAESALQKESANSITWLATKAENAHFERYFKRALMLSATILLFPLIYSLHTRVNPRRFLNTPWSAYLNQEVTRQIDGQVLQRSRFGLFHGLIGLLIASGVFLVMALILFNLNWFQWRRPISGGLLTESLIKAATPAFFTSAIEEIIFRGALLGIFLRAFRPSVAIGSLSFLFAAVHFLQPPSGMMLSDPSAPMAGFEMLRLIALRFLNPEAMLYEFASLFLVGIILAHARYRTASLWIPIGLHAGWIFSFKIFHRLTVKRPDLPQELNFYVGKDLREGLLPILALIITGTLISIYMLIIRPNRSRKHQEERA